MRMCSKRILKSVILVSIMLMISGCTLNEFERNMRCFSGKVSGAMGTFVNSVNLRVQRVRSCKRIKDSKETGGLASLTQGDYLLKSSVQPLANNPGGTLNSSLCYEVKTSGSGANVTEKRILRTPAGKEILISSDTVHRDNGVWQSDVDVQIPTNIVDGEYALIHIAKYKSVNLKSTNEFTVTNLANYTKDCKKPAN